ncbi:TetR/AcrR family transcriptional regulator [Spirochaeta dissipatitropha]
MTNNQLEQVYTAASTLFINQGYGPTQVSQIANKAGIATGSMYKLFSGKKALLHFVLLRTFDPHRFSEIGQDPFREVSSQELEGYLKRIIESLFNDCQASATFPSLLSNIFDYASRYQVAFNIVNWNGVEFPELAAAYNEAIARLYSLLESRLKDFINSGHIRPVEHPRLHIHNILENITWWAMLLPYQEADIRIPEERAKEIALDVLIHGYIQSPQ